MCVSAIRMFIAMIVGCGMVLGHAILADDEVSIANLIHAELAQCRDHLRTISCECEIQRGTLAKQLPIEPTNTSPGERRTIAGRFWIESSAVGSIRLDIDANKLYSTYEVVGVPSAMDVSTKAAVNLGGSIVERFRNVVTGEEWIEATPASDSSDTRPHFLRGEGIISCFLRNADEAKGFDDRAFIIDPRRFFCASGKLSFCELMKMASNAFSSGKAGKATL